MPPSNLPPTYQAPSSSPTTPTYETSSLDTQLYILDDLHHSAVAISCNGTSTRRPSRSIRERCGFTITRVEAYQETGPTWRGLPRYRSRQLPFLEIYTVLLQSRIGLELLGILTSSSLRCRRRHHFMVAQIRRIGRQDPWTKEKDALQ